jgi:hypothetical protein
MKTLIVDGVNYSAFLAKYGYTVGYNKIIGPNTCTTLDGKTHEDIIAEKAVVTVSLRPLNEDNLSIVLNAQSKKSVVVTYFDTKTKADRATNMKVTTPAASLVLENNINTLWGNENAGISMVLEEI